MVILAAGVTSEGFCQPVGLAGCSSDGGCSPAPPFLPLRLVWFYPSTAV